MSNWFKRTIIVLVLFWLGWHLANPIYLVRGSDLGCHIKNGELILQKNWDVLYKNYYSYTNPEYPFINHHWLFGVICYVLWHHFGFTGLAFIYLILELFTFYVFFSCWRRYASFALACAVGLLSFPLIALRSEIRPEGISYLFCGLFWWLIDSYQQKRLKSHHLIIILCILQIIWVNTHLFFIMGPILTVLFWCQARINGEEQQAGILQKLFCFLLGMCLINPSGIAGALEPFNVDPAYFLYPTAENFSVFHFIKVSHYPANLSFIYFMAAAGMLSTVLYFLVQREGFKKYIFIGSLTLFLSLAAMKAERMIGLFGYFWIPLMTYVFGRWFKYAKTSRNRKNIETALVVLGIIVSASVGFDWNKKHSLEIVPGSNDSAEFFKREKILGPIFNDADIGSFLIFHFSPQYKVFVDNRIQPYPGDFIMKTYLPIGGKEELWNKLDQKYHFNVIFIFPEPSYWRGGFITHRLKDPAWALVYLNHEAMIFLKRNAQNAQLIKSCEIRNFKINVTLP